MNFGDILAAIEIGNPCPTHLAEELNRSLFRLRYSDQFIGDSESPAQLGSSILACDDFFAVRWGLINSHRVIFDIEQIISKYAESARQPMLEHLRWMIDSRRNPQTIRQILTPVNNALSVPKRPKVHLDGLARDLEKALRSEIERPLTVALLTGRLSEVAHEAARLREAGQPVPHGRIRSMFIIWGLFDLQVIAAKLHQVEWYTLQPGAKSKPDLLTVDAVRKKMKKLLERAELFYHAYKTNTDPRRDRKAAHFLKFYGLENHARRNALAMGLAPHELLPGQVTPANKALVDELLEEVRKVAHEIYAGFGGNVAHPGRTSTKLARTHAGQKVKIKVGPQQFHSPDDVKMLLKGPSSRLVNVSVLVALIYSVRSVVETVALIPAEDGSLTDYTGKPGCRSLQPTWPRRAQQQLVAKLLPSYRLLFTRDQRSSGKDKHADLLLTDEDPLVPESERTRLGPWASHMGVGLSPEDMVLAAGEMPGKAAAKASAVRNGIGTIRPDLADFVTRHFESSLPWRLADQRYDTIF